MRLIRSSIASLKRLVYDIIEIIYLGSTTNHERFLLRLHGAIPGWKAYKRRGDQKPSEVAIAVECSSTAITECYRQGWIREFGEENLRILDRFESVWPKPEWNVPDFEAFLAEIGA